MTPRPVELKLSRAQAAALADAARIVLADIRNTDLLDALEAADQSIKQYDDAARRDAELEAQWEARMAEQSAKVAAALAKLPKGYKVMRESIGSYERVAAVRSRAEFARLAGITAGEAARYVTETGSGDDMEAAATAPGTMFVRDSRVRGAAWKAAKKS